MTSWATRFRLQQYAKASLWIVPLFGLVLGVALAEAATAVDGASWLPKTWDYSASTASSVLSSVVGAMIALLGFVVTIGVLVIQQATGTLSPRYMRLWYRDRLQKAVLATFTGTFSFAYTLLRSIETDSVPNLGVTLAGIAVSVSLLLLLIYLNRFTHNLRPVAIADIVGRQGEQVLDHAAARVRSSAASYGVPPAGGPVARIRSERGGVIQAFDAAGMVALAARHDCVLVLAASVGDFVPPSGTVVEIHGGAPAPDPRRVTGLLALGTERTIEQDPAFALRILVDIAIRALSPAVNDPTTAIQVLNHIEAFCTPSDAREPAVTTCSPTSVAGHASWCPAGPARTTWSSPSPRSATTARPPYRSADGSGPSSKVSSRRCRTSAGPLSAPNSASSTTRSKERSPTHPAAPTHGRPTPRASGDAAARTRPPTPHRPASPARSTPSGPSPPCRSTRARVGGSPTADYATR